MRWVGMDDFSVNGAHEPAEWNVADVLAITMERECEGGVLWCHPKDAATIKRWLADQGRDLSGALRQLVRLIRAMALADGVDYVRFLYAVRPALRATALRDAFWLCRDRIDIATIQLGPGGIHLREPDRAGGYRDFDISYEQMPRLCALLDVLHNALGYAAVADILHPVTRPGVLIEPPEAVGRELEKAATAWLSRYLDTRHAIRQAQVLRAFLAARGRVAPEAIEDEAILAFWRHQATEPAATSIDGFRLYAGVVRAMLRYRSALADTAVEQQIMRADDLDTKLDLRGAAGSSLAAEVASDWISPAVVLGSRPANRVKWLTRKERLALTNYLGACGEPSEQDEGNSEGMPEPLLKGLAGDQRFDLSLWRTLLRCDVFGAAQESIVARLKKRQSLVSDGVLSGIGERAYEDAASVYKDIRAQVWLEVLAALHILALHSVPEAISLLEAVAGQDAVRGLLATAGPRLRLVGPADTEEPASSASRAGEYSIAGVGALLRDLAQRAPRPVRDDIVEIFDQARAATRKVHRDGFVPALSGDASRLAAFAAAAAPLVSLIRELDRLINVLSRSPCLAALVADKAEFSSVFNALYDRPDDVH